MTGHRRRAADALLPPKPRISRKLGDKTATGRHPEARNGTQNAPALRTTTHLLEYSWLQNLAEAQA